ncbi:MAG TPA: DNA-binding protein [Hyphomicrobium sp.]|uniref:DNA-binding protein n=1 Tax=Hyphomicrobium sp. TaxID=82 RepID=UPI002C9F2893|nr:DNA-binding protein [Hyphomicrobium sp.]HRN87909.1 DNA-binding protein [Hyphomicrobium sp.]
MSLESTQLPQRTTVPPAASPTPGVWPRTADELPLYLTQHELARLLQKSVRTLERDRVAGSGIAFRKIGKTVLYGRDDVIAHLDAARFVSTAEAKARAA